MTFDDLLALPVGAKFFCPGLDCEKEGTEGRLVRFEVINGRWDGTLTEEGGEIILTVCYTKDRIKAGPFSLKREDVS